MTDAERFQKAMQAIFSVSPERAEEIKCQIEAEHAGVGRQEIREGRASVAEGIYEMIEDQSSANPS